MSISYYLVKNETHYWPLGEVSFKNFYTDYGWRQLTKLTEEKQIDKLEKLTVRRSDGKHLTIEEFLDEIKQYQLLEEK